jgi:hypothetical protein
MLKNICVVVLTILSITPCLGRLGETENQCVARYGDVLKRQDVIETGVTLHSIFFLKNGYTIAAGMLKDTVEFEYFAKDDSSALSDDQIQLLLNADADGKQWAKQNDAAFDKTTWIRDDGATAVYEPVEKRLTIFSKTLLAAGAAAQKADDVQKTQGF